MPDKWTQCRNRKAPLARAKRGFAYIPLQRLAPSAWGPKDEELRGKRAKRVRPGSSGSWKGRLVAGAGSNLHLLPEQVKMVAGTGVDHNLQSTPVKMVAGGRNHLYLRSSGGHLPLGAAPDAEETAADGGNFLSALFRTAA